MEDDRGRPLVLVGAEDVLKTCNKCGRGLPATGEYFHVRRGTNDDLAYTCRVCAIQRSKEWHRENRKLVFCHYGGDPPSCACCGETTNEFLCVDHIAGGGNKHRSKINARGNVFYRYLILQGYPIGYQILCHNCNMAKSTFGACPHELQRIEEAAA